MADWDLRLIAFAITATYMIAVALFVIMDRRSATSTFAWLLAFYAFPVIGFVVYVMFGRSWKAFSRETQYVRRNVGREVRDLLSTVLPRQEAAIEWLGARSVPLYSRFLELVFRNSYSAITLRNTVEILQDAAETYPRMMEDMRNAQESIHLEYFIWASDPYMVKVNDLLIEKAKAGVKVRLLFDAAGSFIVFKRSERRRLRAAGVQVQHFSSVWRLHTISYRNHRKITVIDGRIGYTGGLNMGEEHLTGMGVFKAWRDTHVRITGEAVRALQGAFVSDWFQATREKVLDPALFPPVTEPTEDTPVQIISSGPDSKHEAIRQLYFYMIASASRHVYIVSPFFILDQSLAEALKAAALAGVDVKIMLAPRGCGDNPVPYWAAYTYMYEMADAGVKIYLYQPGYLHSKTISVDGLVCSIGSANFDIRSFNIDYELNAIIYDARKTRELDESFCRDLEQCVPFDRKRYRERAFLGRLRDAAARTLSPLL
jgi:cardiolipin synthase